MPDLSILANWAQIISLIVAIIAIVIAIQQRPRAKNKQVLTYIPHPISSPFLIDAGKTIENNIQVLYKGKDVKGLNVMQAGLKNTSNIPIRKTHIIEPIIFTFKSGTELVSKPNVIYRNPKDLKIDCYIAKPNVVYLDFGLFNPDDELTVEFVWTGQREEPELTARIEGVSKIDRLESEQLISQGIRAFTAQYFTMQTFILLIILGITVALPIGLLTGEGLITNILSPRDFYVGITIGFILAGIIGFTSNQIRMRWYRRKAILREKFD